MAHSRGSKLSLSVSLGLLLLACGSTTTNRGDGGGGGSAGGAGGPVTTAGTAAAGEGFSAGHGGVPPSLSTCTAGVLDSVSGLVKCREGFEHRPAAVTCDAVGGAPAELESGGAGGEPSDKPKPRARGDIDCHGNPSACKDFDLGYCGVNDITNVHDVCLSGCLTDADCGAGFVCLCRGYTSHGGECKRANGCLTDHDCGGSLCATYAGACGELGFACIEAQDLCVSDAECTASHCRYGFRPAGGGTNLAFPARVCDNNVCSL